MANGWGLLVKKGASQCLGKIVEQVFSPYPAKEGSCL